MAHLVETMAYAGEVPWHGLGVPVSNDLTPVQMQEKAGLDWQVREVESFIEFDGKRMPTGQKSLVRETDGKILTNVGENWNPVQNDKAFEFFHEFVLSGDMEMHTAGSLKGGQMVWALTCFSRIHTSMASQLTFALHLSVWYATTLLHSHLTASQMLQ